jgi:hypothetical protein
MQTDDTAAAERTALEALMTSQDLGDNAGISRVYFWLGVVFYYGNDTWRSNQYFKNAEKRMMLPEYEKGYLETWLEHSSEGPERDAEAYRGNADPGQGVLRRTRNRGRSPRRENGEIPGGGNYRGLDAAESENNAEETVVLRVEAGPQPEIQEEPGEIPGPQSRTIS